MLGYRFSEYVPNPNGDKSAFENLLNLLMQLLVYTSGDFQEAMDDNMASPTTNMAWEISSKT
jgi:Ca-activated chloride channel homolog